MAPASTAHTRALYLRDEGGRAHGRRYLRVLIAWVVLLVLVLVARPRRRRKGCRRPISSAADAVVLGAEVSATVAPEDPGFFNYTDYEFSALRNLRVGVSPEIRAYEHVQVLGEVRLDQGRVFEAYGLFVRIRPWPTRRFDIQAGRMPPTFGAMSRTAYGSGNLLIGQPLAYQYLTSIRPDALPRRPTTCFACAAAAGCRPSRSATRRRPGLPLVNTCRWDTGVQVHGVNGMVEWTGAVTAGSLSNPRLHDDNDGRQLAGRAVVRPTAAMALACRPRAARGSATRSSRSVAGAGRCIGYSAPSAPTRSIRPGRSWFAAR